MAVGQHLVRLLLNAYTDGYYTCCWLTQSLCVFCHELSELMQHCQMLLDDQAALQEEAGVSVCSAFPAVRIEY